ncbi:pantoate--beta-alanine ligase [Pelagibacterales bacterium SAG-MED38]|nr:pantoate--beta-alanine ligase [Pelagibacterales bacterium SAG-MED38]
MFYLLKCFIQMKTLSNNIDLNEALFGVSNIGFVPTMGSLHDGHISLIKKSLKISNKTIVSIFVNPKQFNNKKDYKKYPRNIKNDLKILKKLKVDLVYLPKIKDIYKYRNKIKIELNKQDKILCAKYRKGHFEGVIEVMTRLTEMINPSKIFMGEKDFQQLLLVKRYVEKNFKSKIISCKTIRGKNKLALSSRNILLNKNNLNKAGKIAKDLIIFKKKLLKKKNLKNSIFIKKKELKKNYDIKIDYLELRNIKNLKLTDKIKNAKIFIAYYINKVRLIDNF